MTKPTTIWRPADGTGEVTTDGGDYITTQAGDNITDQSGNKLITNPSAVTPKPPTTWSSHDGG